MHRQGVAVARCTVERLMRDLGLKGEVRGRGVRTTWSDPAAANPLDWVNRAGVEPSVGSTGDSYDNALAETINGLYKTELVRKKGPWKTVEALEWETLNWVHWFNQTRLLEPIGHIPPAEFEALYELSQQECLTVA